MDSTCAKKLRRTVLLLDGSYGLELKRRKAEGMDVAYNLTLFSTAALRDTPEAVKQLHQDYIKAGAQVITTASYAVTKFYLDKIGEGHRVAELCARSMQLARDAIAAEQAGGRVMIAACVPPLGESYQTTPLTEVEMRAQYAEVLQGLRGADIYLCETFASVSEARLAAAMCREGASNNTRIWVSFTPRRDIQRGGCHLADGSTIEEAVAAVGSMDGLEAVLFNCATPELIQLAISESVNASEKLNLVSRLRIGGYANFWEEVDLEGWSIDKQESETGKSDQKSGGMIVRKDLTDEEYARKAITWIQTGASIVGGCCGIGPSTIARISRDANIGNHEVLREDPSAK